MKSILILYFLMLNALKIYAQKEEILLKKANDLFYRNQYHLAIPLYLDVLKLDSNHAQANYRLGLSSLEVSNKKMAYVYLYRAFNSKSDLPDIEIHLARAYHSANMFDHAIVIFEKLKEQTNQLKQKERYSSIQKKIEECTNAKYFYANPSNAKIENLGEPVNSTFHDYAPVISSDESQLIFTSRRKSAKKIGGVKNQDYHDDIYMCQKAAGKWEKPSNLSSKVNTYGHDAAIAVSSDGKKLYIYKDINGGDLYETKFNGKEWCDPIPMSAKINTRYNESSITISEDGNTIYFVSDKPGGFGGKDIYKSIRKTKNDWTAPINLGPNINTAYDDDAPFLHTDGKILYFSSKGHKNMGGYDIFRSELANNQWAKPENLGVPINSCHDDIYFTISKDLKRGYYSSTKEDGLGESDIYMISMPEYKKIETLTTGNEKNTNRDQELLINATNTKTEFTYKGRIYDEKTKRALEAKIKITDLETEKTKLEMISTKDGTFETTLLSRNSYSVQIEKEGYLHYSDHISGSFSNESQYFIKEIYLQKIKIGSKIILNNIFFETGKSNIQASSNLELNKLIELLNSNLKLKIKVIGYTDNQGLDRINTLLSRARAKAVVDYLVDHGIAVERLKYVGFGKEKPIATNSTEEGRKLNRRTEFEIIGN